MSLRFQRCRFDLKNDIECFCVQDIWYDVFSIVYQSESVFGGQSDVRGTDVTITTSGPRNSCCQIFFRVSSVLFNASCHMVDIRLVRDAPPAAA